MNNKLFSILSKNHTHWYVMPLSLMQLWNSVLGFSTISFRKKDCYLVATISPSSASNYRTISFRVFADKDEQVAEQEAIDWFEKNNLDIEETDNWLISVSGRQINKVTLFDILLSIASVIREYRKKK